MCERAPDSVLYKILPAADWRTAQDAGVVAWSDDDRRDGFMHLSTGRQVLETARRHFRGKSDLVALEIDPEQIASDIRFEPSRNGEPFPHLYGSLPAAAVTRVRRFTENNDGELDFADESGDV